ncbi:class I SAM-dependent methyltransferase [Breoghania sp.]|uniref:class I SAM-dependent methyltransferase n=1 Tax=Breoghania sp. TaxID=2065378 RepID=UPI002AAC32B3|nr:class I SAM-dependent methyltransferase [Breoghania sp.]
MVRIDEFRELSDRQWLDLLIQSTDSEIVQGLQFPRFPAASVQAQFVGSSDKHALNEAFAFYEYFKREALNVGKPILENSNILDFGTGWGRFLRFFWKDVKVDGLHGVDIDPSIVDTCKSLGVPGDLRHIDPHGSLPYADASMDFVLAYSVFTHLPENVHRHWMNEFKRIVRPGGIVGLTIEPRRFLEFVADLKGKSLDSEWHKGLQRFSDYASAMLPAYDSGQLVYIPTGGGDFRDATIYGDAICPTSFVEQNWAPEFVIRSHIDDPAKFWQATLILQKV